MYEVSYGDGLNIDTIMSTEGLNALVNIKDSNYAQLPKASVPVYDSSRDGSVAVRQEITAPGFSIALSNDTPKSVAASAVKQARIYKLAITNMPTERILELGLEEARSVRFLRLGNVNVTEDLAVAVGSMPPLEGIWLVNCRLGAGARTRLFESLRVRAKVVSMSAPNGAAEFVDDIRRLESVVAVQIVGRASAEELEKIAAVPSLRELSATCEDLDSVALVRRFRKQWPLLQLHCSE